MDGILLLLASPSLCFCLYFVLFLPLATRMWGLSGIDSSTHHTTKVVDFLFTAPVRSASRSEYIQLFYLLFFLLRVATPPSHNCHPTCAFEPLRHTHTSLHGIPLENLGFLAISLAAREDSCINPTHHTLPFFVFTTVSALPVFARADRFFSKLYTSILYSFERGFLELTAVLRKFLGTSSFILSPASRGLQDCGNAAILLHLDADRHMLA